MDDDNFDSFIDIRVKYRDPAHAACIDHSSASGYISKHIRCRANREQFTRVIASLTAQNQQDKFPLKIKWASDPFTFIYPALPAAGDLNDVANVLDEMELEWDYWPVAVPTAKTTTMTKKRKRYETDRESEEVSQANTLKCLSCSKSFTKTGLEYHRTHEVCSRQRKQHEQKEYKCLGCNTVFTLRQSWDYHTSRRVCSGLAPDRKWPCRFCLKSVKASYYSRHLLYVCEPGKQLHKNPQLVHEHYGITMAFEGYDVSDKRILLSYVERSKKSESDQEKDHANGVIKAHMYLLDQHLRLGRPFREMSVSSIDFVHETPQMGGSLKATAMEISNMVSFTDHRDNDDDEWTCPLGCKPGECSRGGHTEIIQQQKQLDEQDAKEWKNYQESFHIAPNLDPNDAVARERQQASWDAKKLEIAFEMQRHPHSAGIVPTECACFCCRNGLPLLYDHWKQDRKARDRQKAQDFILHVGKIEPPKHLENQGVKLLHDAMEESHQKAEMNAVVFEAQMLRSESLQFMHDTYDKFMKVALDLKITDPAQYVEKLQRIHLAHHLAPPPVPGPAKFNRRKWTSIFRKQ